MKTIAIIPEFNEEKTINSVVAGVSKHISDILVIDDCSTDDTSKNLTSCITNN